MNTPVSAPVPARAARSEKIRYDVRHQSLDRARETSSTWWPHTAGGHSHRAPATTETMSGANLSATTTTSKPLRRRQSEVVNPVTPAPTTRTLPFSVAVALPSSMGVSLQRTFDNAENDGRRLWPACRYLSP